MFELEPMGWADCFTPEDLIEEIFRQLPDLSFPIPLFEIAEACGITDIIDVAKLPNAIKEKPSEAFPEGFLIDENKYQGIIFYKDNVVAPYRKRFTIAHELAHFLLPHHINKLSFADLESGTVREKSTHDSEHEKEANWFAGELLLPKNLLQDALKTQPLSLFFVKELSETACFSVAPLINRCVSILSDRPIVVVHSKDGVCHQVWANKDVLPGGFVCSKNEKLPGTSIFVRQQVAEQEHITVKVRVSGDAWFDFLPDDFSRSVYEQTYYQKNGYAITLVLVE